MMELAQRQGTAYIVVTHDASLAARCGATLHFATLCRRRTTGFDWNKVAV